VLVITLLRGAAGLVLFMMLYNVAQLLKEPIGSTRSYNVEENFTSAERFADSVYGFLRLLRTHQGVFATADLEVEVTLDCGRCLSTFPLPLTLSIEEEFFPLVDVNTGHRLPIPSGAEGTRIGADHVLDFTDVLRQCVITHVPMKPLCYPNCSGLCQQCGADLNQGDCQCRGANLDPRWKALADLLQQGQSK
jgi:uncharacterized protein